MRILPYYNVKRSNLTEYKTVVWFEIYVEDMKRAKALYEALLAIAFEPAKMEGMDMQIFPLDVDKSGATGALIGDEMQSPHPQGALVYFEEQDCSERTKWPQARDMPFYVPKTDIGEHGIIAIIGDMEGNSIGLHSMA
jgi:predicted enzyme related to lactoylglutathione lyase